MTKPACSRHATDLIKDVVDTPEDSAFAGANEPGDRPTILANHEAAVARLSEYIAKLEAAAPGAQDRQYAIKLKDDDGMWYIARKVDASSYGSPFTAMPETLAWCEIPSTALLCLVGQEKIAMMLPTTA